MEKQTKEQIPSVEEYWESKSELTYVEWIYEQGKAQAISEFKEKLKRNYTAMRVSDFCGFVEKTAQEIKA